MSTFTWLQEDTDFNRLREQNPGPLALTIGNFDGVHLGHQHIFTRMKSWQGTQKAAKLAVLTFRPHPVQVLFPERKHQQLFSAEDQQVQLKAQGVDWVFEKSFTQEFAALTREQFLKRVVEELIKPQAIVVGYDFSFAVNRTGTADDLKNYCAAKGIYFEQTESLRIEDKIVSTTQIRQFLKDGQVQLAKKFLNRCFYLQGKVVKGEQRGRQLGFPTANLDCAAPFFPKQGVYAGYLYWQSLKVRAVANLGQNPTFQKTENVPIKLEIHALDFSQDLYGKEIRFEFEHFIRDEMKFSGVEELKAQIQGDVKMAKELLK